jgi:glycosyltransferase involved in cell wall biosynthesis
MLGPSPTASLLHLIDQLQLQGRVEFAGPVNDQELIVHYQTATLLLFPSLYEGFGWPPLEAMACGCPVVCSMEGSLGEVVGNAALTARANDEQGLADLCLRVMRDPDMASRLRALGRDHVRQFTVERMGRQLLAAYDSILNPGSDLQPPVRSLASPGGA